MSDFYYMLIVEYDGTDFSGWQVQPKKRTVQSELEAALFSLFQMDVKATASGRTDSGVHALGQVVNFSVEKKRTHREIKYGLNSLLPEDIKICSVKSVNQGFNARFDAVRRSYMYQITRNYSSFQNRFYWRCTDNLNTHDMQRCADMILGKHDFQAFCKINAEVNNFFCLVEQARWYYKNSETLNFKITANRFLHNMVRILVGSMVEVGRGRYSIKDFQKMLVGKNRENAGLTAPPNGLFLVKVDY